jgi:hypothetical protein
MSEEWQEEVMRQPLVGDREDFGSLMAEYSAADPVLKAKIEVSGGGGVLVLTAQQLPSKYASLRRVRGDGDHPRRVV